MTEKGHKTDKYRTKQEIKKEPCATKIPIK